MLTDDEIRDRARVMYDGTDDIEIDEYAEITRVHGESFAWVAAWLRVPLEGDE